MQQKKGKITAVTPFRHITIIDNSSSMINYRYSITCFQSSIVSSNFSSSSIIPCLLIMFLILEPAREGWRRASASIMCPLFFFLPPPPPFLPDYATNVTSELLEDMRTYPKKNNPLLIFIDSVRRCLYSVPLHAIVDCILTSDVDHHCCCCC